jgi:hypothetical protein
MPGAWNRKIEQCLKYCNGPFTKLSVKWKQSRRRPARQPIRKVGTKEADVFNKEGILDSDETNARRPAPEGLDRQIWPFSEP